MTLSELSDLLHRFAAGDLSLEALRAAFLPALDADPLDVELSDAEPWDSEPDDERLYWRILHLFDSAGADGATAVEPLRRLAGRLARATASTASATVLELLVLIEDQERFCGIVRKHAAGIISRTGFLSVIAESGYPAHVKLWLQHAGPGPLDRLCAALEAGDYAAAAEMTERAP